MARHMYAAHSGRSHARAQNTGDKQRFEGRDRAHRALKHKSEQVKVGSSPVQGMTEQQYRAFFLSPLSMHIMLWAIKEAEKQNKGDVQRVSGRFGEQGHGTVCMLCARYIRAAVVSSLDEHTVYHTA